MGAESILESTKKVLQIPPEFTEYDIDIIMHINATLSTLNQLGAGAYGGSITGYEETWSDLGVDQATVNLIRSYVYLRVRMLFDPPTQAFLIEAYQKQIDEFGWRIMANQDRGVV